jgi:integrase
VDGLGLPQRRRARLRASGEGHTARRLEARPSLHAPCAGRAKIVKPFRAWHDLRHTALTHEAAAGYPAVYVQLKAGHSQGSITERYIHAAQVLFPGAAAKGELRMFGDPAVASVENQ